jgi:uncharacterized protein YlxP (DUF503 family)
MIVAGLRFEIRIPMANSLKDKRAVLRPLIDGIRRAVSVSVSEVDHHDSWQRSAVGVAVVTPDPGSMQRLVDDIRRRFDENLEIQVIETELEYVEMDS